MKKDTNKNMLEYLNSLSKEDLYKVKNMADSILYDRDRHQREIVETVRMDKAIGEMHSNMILMLRKDGKDLPEIAEELNITPFQARYGYRRALEKEFDFTPNKIRILEKLLDIPELPQTCECKKSNLFTPLADNEKED